MDRYGLRRHFRFGTEIESARFDESRALWRLRTAVRKSVEAEVLITACGIFAYRRRTAKFDASVCRDPLGTAP
ncbi:hypothetical protein RM530_13970 [Algiphilus sp. W345]|uniref:Uncharacterized protein n=1 Tax=Banduia mediterranea TaxID=3075609 RepID=A0ABU2WKP1_9GAMM|nr:hypothetical protein [Algiphilus sp. W345]MDT0498456.1 hypothetical protein [Algiphilus sp. W345]